jgi:hypothetical protein
MPTCATCKEKIHNAFSGLCFKYHPTEIRGRSKQYHFCFKYEYCRGTMQKSIATLSGESLPKIPLQRSNSQYCVVNCRCNVDNVCSL